MRLSMICIAAAILTAGCDNSVQPGSGFTSPFAAAAIPAPVPLPAGGRIIEVGQKVEVASLAPEDAPLFFRLTAPVGGMLTVQVTWQFPLCWFAYAVHYDGRRIIGESAAVANVRVVAGATYDFTVSHANACDWNPGFVLTTGIV